MQGKLLVTFLVAISAFPPLSTDMYLPSLPEVVSEFSTTDALANFTLIAFSIAFGISTLIWGPLSDKYGRRPILIVGLVFYFVGSLLCALAHTIHAMSVARAIQGIGGGSGMVAASAIVRETFSGRRQEGMLAIIQSMVMICPLIAPMFGSAIVLFTDWRGVFYAQTFLGALVLAGAFRYQETLREKNHLGILKSLAQLGALLRHGKFAVLVALFSLPAICIMAHVSSSPFIYQDGFKLSAFAYSLFFGMSAAGAIIGPALYMVASKKFRRFSVVTICFAIAIFSGAAACLVGESSPWIFSILMFLLGISCSSTRPAGSYLVLNFHRGDTGAAAALLTAGGFLMGGVGMALVALSPHYILMIGICAILVGGLALLLWFAISRYYDVDQNTASH